MLINNTLKLSGDKPSFSQSVKTQNLYEEILIDNISFFLKLSASHMFESTNEDRFNQDFYIETVRYFNTKSRGVVLIPEFKDYVTIGANSRKRVDFAFVSSAQGACTKQLYVVEAKRLPTDKEQGRREKEYVCGHKKDTGALERYKSGSHGLRLSKSAVIGYIEQDDFNYWNKKINEWISERASSTPSVWSTSELLNNLLIDKTENFSTSRSIINRKSDYIELFHLWIKMPS